LVYCLIGGDLIAPFFLQIKTENKMEITFSKQDAVKILFDSFCNGGLSELSMASIIIDWDSDHNTNNYLKAKTRLLEQGKNELCYEDICMGILEYGDTIQFTDYEGDDEIISLHIEDALVNFNSLDSHTKIELSKLLNDDDCSTDAWDCFNAIQYALFGDVVYG
jgi:hypothetical protein